MLETTQIRNASAIASAVMAKVSAPESAQTLPVASSPAVPVKLASVSATVVPNSTTTNPAPATLPTIQTPTTSPTMETTKSEQSVVGIYLPDGWINPGNSTTDTSTPSTAFGKISPTIMWFGGALIVLILLIWLLNRTPKTK